MINQCPDCGSEVGGEPVTLYTSSLPLYCCNKCGLVVQVGNQRKFDDIETAADWAGTVRPTLYIVWTAAIWTQGRRVRDSDTKALHFSHVAKIKSLIRVNRGFCNDTTHARACAVFRSVNEALSFALVLSRDTGHPEVAVSVCIHTGPVEAIGKTFMGEMINVTGELSKKFSDRAGVWLTDRVKGDLDLGGEMAHRHLIWSRKRVSRIAPISQIWGLDDGGRGDMVSQLRDTIANLGGVRNAFGARWKEFYSFLNENRERLINLGVDPCYCSDEGPYHGRVRAYGRDLLWNSPDLEILIARWVPGLECASHNHAGGVGWVVVLDGEFSESKWMFQGGVLKRFQQTKLTGDCERPFFAVSKRLIHSMSCVGGGTTLHFYIPDSDPTEKHMGMLTASSGSEYLMEIQGDCPLGKGGAYDPPDLWTVRRICRMDNLPPTMLSAITSSNDEAQETLYVDGLPRIVIATALALESDSVSQFLSLKRRSDSLKRDVYYWPPEDPSFEVLLIETGMGNVKASVNLGRILGEAHPVAAFFVGVCGGIKDVNVNDVVYSTKIYYTEMGKESAGQYHSRADVLHSSALLVNVARDTSKTEWWATGREGVPPPDRPPRASGAVVASGENVLGSREDSSFHWKKIRANFSDAQIVEMEGYGFLTACSECNIKDAIVIRGVSDLLEGKEKIDQSGGQHAAASNAAKFLFRMLEQMRAMKI